jgi:hypothetical protein
MSEIGPPHGVRPPPAPPPDDPYLPLPPPRNGCLTAIMILAGIVLLLPGLCVLILTANLPPQRDNGLVVLGTVGVVAGCLGVAMIVWAIVRKPRR